MSWNSWIRQFHRWVSIAFTLTVIANFVVLGMTGGRQPPAYITYSPLLPLALLHDGLRHAIESRMALHMLVEFPLLLAGGG